VKRAVRSNGAPELWSAMTRALHDCDYQRRGLPIGSWVTEGACKSVVNVRAKRSGQRWSQRGLTAALHLRAMHESYRFDGSWSFFSRRYRAKNIVPPRHR
jgi:hypothetical protein